MCVYEHLGFMILIIRFIYYYDTYKIYIYILYNIINE